jgi:hypothetical protein
MAEYEKLLDKGHFYALETGKSEDLAAFAHFFLTVTPYGHSKRDWQKDIGGQTANMDASPDRRDTDRNKTPKDTPTKPKEPTKDSKEPMKDNKPAAEDDKKSATGKSDKEKKPSKNK